MATFKYPLTVVAFSKDGGEPVELKSAKTLREAKSLHAEMLSTWWGEAHVFIFDRDANEVPLDAEDRPTHPKD